jgi:hypothetical protein
VTVVDHLPFGAGNELLPALRQVRADGGRAILGLRDVDDHGRLAGSAWRREGLRSIATLYRAALVYGPPAAGDARVPRLRSAGVPVHHVARIVAEPDIHAPNDLPAEYLLAAVGGGIDGFRPLSVLLEALRLRPLGLPSVLVAGPLMPAAELARLRALAAGLDARIEHQRGDMLAVVRKARAVVAMAGYNTVAEVLQAGAPALLVPRSTPSKEQLVRALRLRDAGLASVIAPHELDPERLRRALGALLRRDRSQPSDTRGARAAAELILSVAGPSQRDTAARPRLTCQRSGASTAMEKGKGGSKEGKGGGSPSQSIDARIKELSDWRGETLARIRNLIKQADPDAVEEWKWRGVPVWSHAGIICTGETYKNVVKMTFAKGASLEDPSGLFNSSLEGNTRRAIDLHEGDEIDEKALKALIRAAVELNTS